MKDWAKIRRINKARAARKQAAEQAKPESPRRHSLGLSRSPCVVDGQDRPDGRAGIPEVVRLCGNPGGAGLPGWSPSCGQVFRAPPRRRGVAKGVALAPGKVSGTVRAVSPAFRASLVQAG